MPSDAQDSYFESRILTADGIQLIQILYQAAVDSAEQARECLRRADIAGRSRAISKAYEIITELEVSLDHEAGGEVSRNLRETYCYLRGRLITANVEQIDAPLEEVARLLRIILEAWLECKEIVVRPRTVQQEAQPELEREDELEVPPVEEPCGGYGWSGYAGSYTPASKPLEYHVSVSY